MVEQKTKSKTDKVLISIGSVLLILMALFHGSGFFFVSDLMNESNADGFLKEIVPVLFAHPSIHLLGLSALGLVTLYLRYEAKKILLLLTILVLADAILAFAIGGLIPGILLTIPVLCFAIAAIKINRNLASS